MGEKSEQSRRRFVKGSLGAATGLALAGCTGGTGDGNTTTTAADEETTTTATTTAGETTTDEAATEAETTEADETTTESESYTVSMAPVGEVTFESVPEKWSAYFPGYADMGVALGQADGLSAAGVKARYYTVYYDELDGVSVNKDDLVELVGDNGIDKEIFYEMGNDVHLTDPEWLASNSFFGLERNDVDQIATNVAPFVGNTIFRRTDDWHDYQYYTMYEAFEKVAQVFQKQDQYEAFESFHDSVLSDVSSSLPAESERPNGLLCYAAADQPEEFSPYRISGQGTNKKHFHDLGVSDALAETNVEGLSESNRGTIDYETMLEVDPEAIFIRGHETKTREEFQNTVLSFMEDHNVASALTAVQNGDVYRGGPIYQGPIQNLFITERFATLLYPDAYGGDLFDRGKLSEIIAGEF